VQRTTLYEDYLSWCEQVYLAPYRDSEYFRLYPQMVPKPDEEIIFYSSLYPWIYLVGKKKQVRSYLVDTKEAFEGQWYETKKMKYFVRLCSWEDHVAAFELYTGHDITQPYEFDPSKAESVAIARKRYADRMQETREKMEAGAGGD
jgi:hypothetical protein